MSFTDIVRLRRQLTNTYESLTPLEQAILQLLSVIYDGVTKTAIADCLRRCNLPLFKAKGFPQPGLNPLLNKLVRENLVIDQRSRFRCHPLIVEEVARRAVRDGRFEDLAKTVQGVIKLSGWSGYLYFYSYGQALRELRIAFYRRDTPQTQLILATCAKQFPDEFFYHSPWLLVFNNPFSEEWLRTLPEDLLSAALCDIFTATARRFEPVPEALALAEALLAENRCVETLRYYLAEHYLLRGEPDRARQYLGADDTDHSRALWGWLAFSSGEDEEAIQHYETALKLLRQRTRKRKIFFDTMAGVCFILALLASNSTERLHQAADLMALFDKKSLYHYAPTYWILHNVVLVQQGQLKELPAFKQATDIPAVDHFFELLAQVWLDNAEPAVLRGPAEALLGAARESGYRWFELTLTELLQRLDGPKGAAPAVSRPKTEGRSLVQLFRRQEIWEHALNRLLEVSQTGQESPVANTQTRLVWWLNWYENGYCRITPREQKRDARGLWTRGRSVALKRLYGHSEQVDYLTPQDLRICACIRAEYGGYYGSTSYVIDYRKALPAMVGHPLVFWEDAPEVRVELVRGEPELVIGPQNSHWRLEFSPKTSPGESVGVVKETPTRLKVIEFSDAHKQILAVLGDGLLVPAAAKDRVLETIAALSGLVTVQSSIGGGVENLEEVAADSLPHVHLLPFGEGLKVELLVRPFASGGPYYRPGVGGERVIAEIDGKRLQTCRDLHLESQRAAQIVAAAPTLSDQEGANGEWVLSDPQACLEALLELQNLGDLAVLEWPEGEKFKVSRQVSFNQLSLTIKRQRDWFNLTGELRLEDDQVMDMQRLLELLQQTPSRFIPLGEGQFLTLTREFRKRLEELRGFTELTAKGARFHPLAALALEEFTTEAGAVRGDADWKAHIERLREAEALQPVVPSTLQGELRDYQVEGFEWLARLAHWGVGACLADDMGLGKTVQALALLLSRAQDGPALVVAPTSVCLNWLDEARRFAPTLRVIIFGGGDREQTLKQLGPFDLLVCSYASREA